ncbi:PREDICTED: histone acetyltransferase type B catalytic subunit-like [Acropora digitifera]|nr:PREDICTED: histone acetyltransferase type B catalytic subunit-like [Acropora digitifera]
MGLKHDGEVNNKVVDGVQPDPVLSVIAEKYPAGCMTNLDEFIAKLPEEAKFMPMGELLHSYKCNDAEYEIYKADVTTPRLKDYHERLQTFLLWFIDASSYIDPDDERWRYFLV